MANIHCPKCASAKIMAVPESDNRVCYDCEYEFVVEKPFTPMRMFLSYSHASPVRLV